MKDLSSFLRVKTKKPAILRVDPKSTLRNNADPMTPYGGNPALAPRAGHVLATGTCGIVRSNVLSKVSREYVL